MTQLTPDDLPASPEGKPYSGGIEHVEWHQATGTDRSGFLIVIRLRAPRQYRGIAVVDTIIVDIKDDEIMQRAVAQMTAAGLTEDELLHKKLAPLLEGRSVYFNFTPASTLTWTRERIEIVGLAYNPATRKKH